MEMSFFGAPPKLERLHLPPARKGYAPSWPTRNATASSTRISASHQRLKDLGCRFQLNILSLSGYYDRPIQQAAEKLVRLGMADYLCTDLHHQRHADHLKEALESKGVRKRWGRWWGRDAMFCVSGG
ncbi:MAG: hypothetical protein IPN20_04945 [Haliscomenobacter sp.]|nr:hypothetical protein [Haliscomenobacter sp.]